MFEDSFDWDAYLLKQKNCDHVSRYRMNWASTICNDCGKELSRQNYPETE